MTALIDIEDILEQIADGEHHPYPLESWKRLLWNSEDGLGGFVNQIVANARKGAASQEIDQKELDRCWLQIGGRAFLPSLQILARLQRWQVGPASPFQETIDLERLAARIQSHFASGITAYLSYRVLKGDAAAWKPLCKWVERATGGRIAADYAEPTWGRGRTEADVIQHALLGLQGQPNAYQSRADGSHRIGQRLRTSLSANVFRQRRVPIVGVGSLADEEMDRWIGWLVLDLLTGDGGELIEAPDLWNRPLGNNLVGAIREAYEAAWPEAITRPSVRWSLDFPGLDGYMPLSDTSLGLAAHVGFRVLRDKRHYDGDCVFSARVEGGEIKTVSGLGKKSEALSRQKVPDEQGNPRNRFRWFGIAAEADDFTESQLQDRRANKVWIEKIETIGKAVELATRTDRGIRQFLQAVKDYPDHGTDLDDQQKRFDKRPHYMPHDPSQLYVVPDVIIRPLDDVLEQQSRAAKEKKSDDDKSKPVQPLTAQDRDVREEELNPEQRDVEQRNWAEVCESAARTPRQRGVLLGPAGQGKSFLSDMTASRLADAALRTLEDITTPVELAEVALPLVVSLPRVLALPQLAGHDSSQHVREAMATALEERFGNLTDEARSFVRAQMLQRHIWMFLDGLDEVHPGSSDLRALLQFTATAEGPVFLAGRPYGLSDHRGAVRAGWFGLDLKSTGRIPEEVKVYRLAPFDSDLIREYVDKWFGHREQVPLVLTNLLRTNASVRALARTPYLLSLFCAVAARQANLINERITRSELYDLFLEMLFEVFGRERASQWEEFLPRMAIRMVGRHEEAVRDPFIAGRKELESWLKEAELEAPLPLERYGADSRNPRQKGEALANELSDRRLKLLVERVVEGNRQFVFSHRSLGEFLAGKCFAWASDQDESDGWRRPLPRWVGPWLGGHSPDRIITSLAWRNDWHEIIRFIAGNAQRPGHLIGLLTTAVPDDVLLTRTALAGGCLADARIEQTTGIQHQLDRVTARLMDAIDNMNAWHAPYAGDHLIDSFKNMAFLGRRDGIDLSSWLAQRAVEPRHRPWVLKWIACGGPSLRSLSLTIALSDLLNAKIARNYLNLHDDWLVEAVSSYGWITSDPIHTKIVEMLSAAQPQLMDLALRILADSPPHSVTGDLITAVQQSLTSVPGGSLRHLAKLLRNSTITIDCLPILVFLVERMTEDKAYPYAVPTNVTEIINGLDVSLSRALCTLLSLSLPSVGVSGLQSAFAVHRSTNGHVQEWLKSQQRLLAATHSHSASEPVSAAQSAAVSQTDQRGIVAGLATQLLSNDVRELRNAMRGLQEIGQIAAIPSVLGALTVALRHTAPSIVREAARTVRALRPSVSNDELRTRLCDLLSAPDERTQIAAVLGVCNLDNSSTAQEILSKLSMMLRTATHRVRYVIADAICEMRPKINDPTFVSEVLSLLSDPCGSIVCAAARAIGNVDAASFSHVTLEVIADALIKSKPRTAKKEILSAIHKLKAVTSADQAIMTALSLLAESSNYPRTAFLWAVGIMETTLIDSAIIDAVGRHLADAHSIRREAAEVVCRLGPLAASDVVVLPLIHLICKPIYAGGLAFPALVAIGDKSLTRSAICEIATIGQEYCRQRDDGTLGRIAHLVKFLYSRGIRLFGTFLPPEWNMKHVHELARLGP